VYAKGGRRGLVLIPEGREGRGWSRFASKLSKVEAFFNASIILTAGVVRPPSGVASSGEKRGHRPSFA
jgi:hypothetical protein